MRKQLIIFFILLSLGVKGQNLVPNPSFEDYVQCYWTYHGGIVNIPPWYVPNNSNPNYNNTCPKPIGYQTYNAPKNVYGYQYPRTGDGYVFVGNTYVTHDLNEHITIQLDTALEVGKDYCLSYYIVVAEGPNKAFDKTGCYFSVDSLYYPTIDNLIFITPQINNPSGNMINDTLEWIQISGSITADSAYSYITLGTFETMSQVITYVINSSLPSYNTFGYYIDDVAVYPCDAPVYVADGGGDVQLCLGDSVVLGSHERDEYLYWWYDMQGNLIADSTGFITVKPQQTTQYELVVKDFKFEETRDTITVYVEDCFTDDIFVPNIFSPNGDGNNDILFVRSEYIQSMKFQIYNRWGEMVFESKDINYGWNGEYNGKRCNPSVFVWHLETTMTNGQVVQRSGNVTLVR
jgi:gliding motility-associated-like protein